MAQSQTEADGALTEDEIATLFEAGASPEFVQLAQVDDGKRNSIRENAQRVLDGRVNGEITEVTFGHFGMHVWKGEMFNAMKRADKKNTRRMLEVFGLEYINGWTQANTRYDGFKEEDGQVFFK